MKILNLLSEIMIGIALCSCATTSAGSAKNNYGHQDSTANSGPELKGVGFLSNRPTGSDGLMDAVEDPVATRIVLLRNIETMRKIDGDRLFRIIGNTDNKECSNEAQCIDLSRRRAKLLQAWLIDNGLPIRKLKDPVGYGSSRPMQDNSKDTGRRVNRNAYIDFEG